MAIVLVFIGMLHATTIHCHGFLEMEIKINAKQDHNIINGYRLPYYIGNNEQIAKKTAIAALSESELFIFGNGNVYQLENNQIIKLFPKMRLNIALTTKSFHMQDIGMI